MTNLWVGFDFDGTLVGPPSGGKSYGDDYPAMLSLLKLLIEHNIQVKIFTARAAYPQSAAIVQDWITSRGLPNLPITDKKDFNLALIIDNYAISVKNGDLITPLIHTNTLLSQLGIQIQPI